jgi:hypothetical protein
VSGGERTRGQHRAGITPFYNVLDRFEANLDENWVSRRDALRDEVA